MVNLLITGAVANPVELIEKITAKNNVTVTFVQNELEPLKIPVEGFDAVVCNGLFLHNNIDDFKSLKFIQATSAGLDRIPVEKIRERGIALYNARGVYSVPMAEWAISKILDIYKKSQAFIKNQELKQWVKNRDIKELYGQRSAIVGVGSVGIEVAKRLSVFGVDCVGVDIVEVKSEYLSTCYNINDIGRVINDFDIIILTLPLTEKTFHLFDKCLFDRIKSDAILVNISRGSIICESDLIDALESSKLSAAALDVFEYEPLSQESKLWNMENVIITPHNSFVSDIVSNRFNELALKNFVMYYETEE